jgi:hypothetical protein
LTIGFHVGGDYSGVGGIGHCGGERPFFPTCCYFSSKPKEDRS